MKLLYIISGPVLDPQYRRNYCKFFVQYRHIPGDFLFIFKGLYLFAEVFSLMVSISRRFFLWEKDWRYKSRDTVPLKALSQYRRALPHWLPYDSVSDPYSSNPDPYPAKNLNPGTIYLFSFFIKLFHNYEIFSSKEVNWKIPYTGMFNYVVKSKQFFLHLRSFLMPLDPDPKHCRTRHVIRKISPAVQKGSTCAHC